MKKKYCNKNGEVSPEKISKEVKKIHLFLREIYDLQKKHNIKIDSQISHHLVLTEMKLIDLMLDVKGEVNKDLCGV